VVGDQFSASSVLFTDVTGTVSKRHKDFGVDSLIDFETANFANITSNTDNGADIRNFSDHTSNSHITANQISLQTSQRKNLLLGCWSINNIKFAKRGEVIKYSNRGYTIFLIRQEGFGVGGCFDFRHYYELFHHSIICDIQDNLQGFLLHLQDPF